MPIKILFLLSISNCFISQLFFVAFVLFFPLIFNKIMITFIKKKILIILNTQTLLENWEMEMETPIENILYCDEEFMLAIFDVNNDRLCFISSYQWNVQLRKKEKKIIKNPSAIPLLILYIMIFWWNCR